MKMRKVLMVFLLGLGLFGFTSASMAQSASDGKSACDYLTKDEVSSIIGSLVKVMSFNGISCIYDGGQDNTVTFGIRARNLSSEVLLEQYQERLKAGGKPVQGMGETAVELEDKGLFKRTVVYFFKNGVTGSIAIRAKQDQVSKAEALAKIIVNKL